MLCYNLHAGHGQMLRVVGLPVRTRRDVLPYGFLSINPGIRLYGVEAVDTGDEVDSKKRQENQAFPANPVKRKRGRSSVG